MTVGETVASGRREESLCNIKGPVAVRDHYDFLKRFFLVAPT